VSTSPFSYRVLVIDDTPAIHDDFRKVFEPSAAPESLDREAAMLFDEAPPPAASPVGFKIDSAFQGSDGIEMVRAALNGGQPYALAFVDMRMPPGMDGLETIRHLWALDNRLQVVICTAHSDRSWHEIRTELGPTDNLIVLKKPFDHIEAQQLAHALAQKWTLARENEAHVRELNARVEERTDRARAAEDRFSVAFNANPHPQALIALAPVEILEINPAFARVFGLAAGQSAAHLADTFASLQQGGLVQRLMTGEPIDAHPFTYARSARDERDLRASARRIQIGSRVCSLWQIEDVTEQHRLEKQLRQAQKMEAVGQLAAGIAHDFNNLLTVIRYYTEDQTTATGATGLVQIRDAVDRAAALTRQLLVFSRRQVTKLETVNVIDALRGIQDMLGRLIPERLQLQWDMAEPLPPVVADVANLEQAVINLVINARDATPGSGLITIGLKPVELKALPANAHPRARTGAFVALSVSDSGTGIAPDVLSRLFEPFFTTKESGKGTGLGLSTVQRIAEQHDGWVQVDSRVAYGSTFTIYIPAAARSGPDAPATPAEGSVFAPGGGERLLVVEDDPTVRAAACGIVEQAGYHVTEAEDGPTALRRWHHANGAFDLLFTDLVLPNGISGLDLARRLRADKPDLKVVFTTGYSDQLLNEGRVPSGDAVILKPYTLADVTAKLREVLQRTPDRVSV
jgi:signal transduction histidine kinase